MLRGVVRDARGGEPLGRVEVRVDPEGSVALTDDQGRFEIGAVEAGPHQLRAYTVGYWMVRQTFSLNPGEVKEFEIILNADSRARADSVQVTAGPFAGDRQASPSALTLDGVEAKNLAGVLTDDPLRAVQSLPGVGSNDDFDSRFSLRGAGFSRIGLYLDGILLHAPFHMVAGETATGTATAINGDLVDTLTLDGGAFSPRYGDRTAGILAVETREGTRTAPAVRVTASASFAGIVAEGPLGKRRRGSWLAAARKSYLQYIIRRTTSDADPSFAFGILDGQAKLAYDLSPAHQMTLSLIDGYSDLDRTGSASTFGINTLAASGYHLSLATLGWRYAPQDRLLWTARTAWMRERFENRNRDADALQAGHYGEWTGQSDLTWVAGRGAALDAGFSARRLHDNGYENRYQFNPAAVQRRDDYRGSAWRTAGFAQYSWSAAGGGVRWSAGVRWERDSVNRVGTVLPHAALSLALAPSTVLRLAAGQYAQSPEIQHLYSAAGSPKLLPERATQLTAAIEQSLGYRARLRAEFYQRTDRDLLFRPFYEPRLIGGKIFIPSLNAPFRNSLRGYARGFEVFLQRRSANRLAGWLSYAYGRTRLRDGEAGISFPADEDQRHTANVFGSYRLRPSVNVSVKWLYGSGYPLPGFYRVHSGQYYLAEARNAVKTGSFQRVDLRINKSRAYARWKLTLYGEVINVFNRANYRFSSFDGYNAKTGRVSLSVTKMFPVIPSAGVVVEFGAGR